MDTIKDIRISQKADTFANLVKNDPIVLPNEIVIEQETGRWRLGTGDLNDKSTWKHWSELNSNENGKGFTITAINGNKYTLSSVDGIKVGDRICIRLTHSWDDYTKITGISTGNKTITLEKVPEDILETDSNKPEKGVFENYITIVGKPNIGDQLIGYFAHAEGENSIAQNRAAHAEGRETKAIGQYSHAEGRKTVAGYAAHAEGKNTQALGDNSHAEGVESKAYDISTHAEGEWCLARGIGSHVEGYNSRTYGRNAHAEGTDTIAGSKGFKILSYDKNNKAVALSSVTGLQVGQECYLFTTDRVYENSITAINSNNNIVTLTNAYYGNSTTSTDWDIQNYLIIKDKPGLGDVCTGFQAHAQGKGVRALGVTSHAEGEDCQAIGRNSHAEGYQTKAKGYGSHAEGNNTVAEGQFSYAAGRETKTYGSYSHAEGYQNQASGDHSHVEGEQNYASGDNSHAEGKYTSASGECGHAEGWGSRASAIGAHAEGLDAYANHIFSHAQGYETSTGEEAQFVLGKYNKVTTGAVIVGGGNSEDNRRNIHTLDWNGNAWFASDITIGENKDKVVTENQLPKQVTQGIELVNPKATYEDVFNIPYIINGAEYYTTMNKAGASYYIYLDKQNNKFYVTNEYNFPTLSAIPLETDAIVTYWSDGMYVCQMLSCNYTTVTFKLINVLSLITRNITVNLPNNAQGYIYNSCTIHHVTDYGIWFSGYQNSSSNANGAIVYSPLSNDINDAIYIYGDSRTYRTYVYPFPLIDKILIKATSNSTYNSLSLIEIKSGQVLFTLLTNRDYSYDIVIQDDNIFYSIQRESPNYSIYKYQIIDNSQQLCYLEDLTTSSSQIRIYNDFILRPLSQYTNRWFYIYNRETHQASQPFCLFTTKDLQISEDDKYLIVGSQNDYMLFSK